MSSRTIGSVAAFLIALSVVPLISSALPAGFDPGGDGGSGAGDAGGLSDPSYVVDPNGGVNCAGSLAQGCTGACSEGLDCRNGFSWDGRDICECK
jgi:hypothetical protein